MKEDNVGGENRGKGAKGNFVKDFVLDEFLFEPKKKKYRDMAISCLVFSFLAAIISVWSGAIGIIFLAMGHGVYAPSLYFRLIGVCFAIFCIVAASIVLKRRKSPAKKDCVLLAISISFTAVELLYYLIVMIVSIVNIALYPRDYTSRLVLDLLTDFALGIVPKAVFLGLCGGMLSLFKDVARRGEDTFVVVDDEEFAFFEDVEIDD